MSAQPISGVIKPLPVAPIDGAPTTDLAYNMVVMMMATPASDKATTLSISDRIAALLEDEMAGMGPVDLVSMTLRYKFTASGQEITAGIVAEGSTVTASTLFAHIGAFSMTANNMNLGVQVEEEMIIPDMYSRQMRPVPSRAPEAKLVLQATRGVKVAIILKIKFYGPILKLKSQTF